MIFRVFQVFEYAAHAFLYKQNFYWKKQAEIDQKNQAKAKLHNETELLLFENYLLSSSTLSSKNFRAYSKTCAKKQVCLFVYYEIIWLIIMKMKENNRSHRCDINRPTFRHRKSVLLTKHKRVRQKTKTLKRWKSTDTVLNQKIPIPKRLSY